jgi:hypothetical protein
MSTQNAILSENQYMSDNGQEREQTLQEEATGNHIGEIGTVESRSLVDIPHHGSCCCISCWQKNFHS